MTWSVVFVAACLAGCSAQGETSPTSVDQPSVVDASAYAAVLTPFLPAPDGDERPVVWITQLGTEPISLSDQVDMIAELAATHDLRFVDDPDAAVDDQEGDLRDGGLLLGIGTIRHESPHTVRVEVYSHRRRVRAELLTMSVGDDGWRIDGREVVDPEDLVLDD
ncbi:MAG: hypothetical protein ABIP17_15485 [Ilumatobacteraceae bacterium]